jgi:hypothetical protein
MLISERFKAYRIQRRAEGIFTGETRSVQRKYFVAPARRATSGFSGPAAQPLGFTLYEP